jgi:lipoate-protein ligase A
MASTDRFASFGSADLTGAPVGPRPTVGAWRLLANDQPTAARQMGLDLELAQRGQPTLRLFRWAQPALSLGYRQAPPAWLDAAALARQGIEVVERPTGGGIAVHGSDVSVSVAAPRAQVPSIHELMRLISECLVQSARAFGVMARSELEHPGAGRIAWCLAEPSPFAILVDDRKLCGLAIRRLPDAWLVQGSMLVRSLPAALEEALPPEVSRALNERAIGLSQAAGRKVFEDEITAGVARAWRSVWGVPCEWAQIEWPRSQTVEWLTEGDVFATKWWRKSYGAV